MKEILPWLYSLVYLLMFGFYALVGDIVLEVFWGVLFLASLMLALKGY